MKFLTDLVLKPMPGRKWRVVNDFTADTETVGAITVPAGFITDLSSIPRFLWWESAPSDYPEAGVLHDYCYHDNLVPQAVADKLYREVLAHLQAGTVREHLRYWALRVFGSHAYKDDAPAIPQ